MTMTGMSKLMDKVASRVHVNRAFTLSLEDIRHSRSQWLDQLAFPDETVTCIYLDPVPLPLNLLSQIRPHASDTVYRKRLQGECVFPLIQENASLLVNDRPAANCLEAAPRIPYRVGVEKGICREDLLYAQDPLGSLCPATGLNVSCQVDPVRLAASTA